MALKQVAILGGGNMGSAIARAIWENEDLFFIPSDQVVVAEPDEAKRAALSTGNDALLVPTARQAIKALADDGVIILAVKPQMFSALAAEVGDVGPRLVISIMAGCMAARVHRELGGRCRVVRAMPNLAVVEVHGTTGLAPGPGATEADLDFAKGLFGEMGICIVFPETMMDGITAVASSGIAYVFYLAEAMTRAAMEIGFTPDAARDLVKQTVFGAACVLLEDGSAEELRRRVTSKGGTTQAAIDVLDQAGVKDAFVRAITAARDRGRELSQS